MRARAGGRVLGSVITAEREVGDGEIGHSGSRRHQRGRNGGTWMDLGSFPSGLCGGGEKVVSGS